MSSPIAPRAPDSRGPWAVGAGAAGVDGIGVVWAGGVLCGRCAVAVCGEVRRRMPAPVPAGLPECWSAADYAGPVRRAVIAYKERGRTALARPLAAVAAQVLGVAVDTVLGPDPPVVGVVPVPSLRAARGRRGHDPVGRLAALTVRALARSGRPAVLSPLVEHRGRVADQAGLSASLRAANLSGAFRLRRARGGGVPRVWPPSGVAVLLDDVVTTGATLAEAALTLRAAGLRVPLAVTLAATPRRHPLPRAGISARPQATRTTGAPGDDTKPTRPRDRNSKVT
ncbi:ComF family protein [Spongiactinospora sp. 9N601]|uniref:ComF family protein n=1 Tax=Spongiactinospora sp. 9N601 TaxID=3375149 RepID=UPI0037B02295